MSKFVVMLEGSGVPIDAQTCARLGLGHDVRSLGFMTTRVVDAVGTELAVAAAIAQALAELRSGPLLNGIAIASIGEPEIKAMSVRKVAWWRAANTPTKGFSFYPEQGATH